MGAFQSGGMANEFAVTCNKKLLAKSASPTRFQSAEADFVIVDAVLTVVLKNTSKLKCTQSD